MIQNKKEKTTTQVRYQAAIAEMEAVFLDFQKELEKIKQAQKRIIKNALRREEEKRIRNILGQIQKNDHGR